MDGPAEVPCSADPGAASDDGPPQSNKKDKQLGPLILASREAGITQRVEITGIINRTILANIIDNGYVSGLERSRLSKLQKLVEKNGTYKIVMTERTTACGRVYPEDYTIASAASLWRQTRGALFSRTYVEIDIAASHPTVLCDIAIQYGYELSAVREYLVHRKETIRDAALAFCRAEDSIKCFFNAAIYGSRRTIIVGNDKVKRRIDIPFTANTLPPSVSLEMAERARRRMEAFSKDVRTAYDKLLTDKKLCADYAPNIRWQDEAPTRMFRLLEIGERRNMHALLMAIKKSEGLWVSADVIFDGVLVRKGGGGEPCPEWADEMQSVCAEASAIASTLFKQSPRCESARPRRWRCACVLTRPSCSAAASPSSISRVAKTSFRTARTATHAQSSQTLGSGMLQNPLPTPRKLSAEPRSTA